MKRFEFLWYWKSWQFGSEFRFNGGGYLYGHSPYKQWSIGPLRIRKYL